MIFVERCHDPVRRALNIDKKECPDLSDEQALQRAVRAVNGFVCPEGISTTIAVYGANSRLGLLRDRPLLLTNQKVVAVKKATQALTMHLDSRQVQDALRARNKLNVAKSFFASIGSHALAYRIKRGRWEGQYTILDSGRDEVYLLPSPGPLKLCSTVSKSFVTPRSEKGSAQHVCDSCALQSIAPL